MKRRTKAASKILRRSNLKASEQTEEQADESLTEAGEGNEVEPDSAEAEQVDRDLTLFMHRGISASIVDTYADCPKKLSFLLKGHEGAQLQLVRESVDSCVRYALTLIMQLDPEQRTHAAVEPALDLAWFHARGRSFVTTEESDGARTEVRKILHGFIESHDLSGHTTAQDVTLLAQVPTGLGEVCVEVGIERISVDADGSGLTLTAYDLGDPGRYRDPIEEDAMIRMWLLAATDSLRERVRWIKNVFVRYDVEEVFEIGPNDVEASRLAIGKTLDRLRMESDFEAEPGAWCGSCDYRFICASRDVPVETEVRIARYGGIV